jgi:hypothetical protein
MGLNRSKDQVSKMSLGTNSTYQIMTQIKKDFPFIKQIYRYESINEYKKTFFIEINKKIFALDVTSDLKIKPVQDDDLPCFLEGARDSFDTLHRGLYRKNEVSDQWLSKHYNNSVSFLEKFLQSWLENYQVHNA